MTAGDAMRALAPLVTVIIPTTAQAARSGQIRRCVDSIRASSVRRTLIVAVINGRRPDPAVCAWLQAHADIRCVFDLLPSAPNAVWLGRQQVRTVFFSTLDDDDEYLPHATDQKLAALHAHGNADLVVTNALRLCDGHEALVYQYMAPARRQPLADLFRANWLNSGNALYRSSSVPARYFEDYRPYAEWTWLAFKLGMDAKVVATLEQPTFRVHVTAGSLSQSTAYFEHYLLLYQHMLAAGPPRAVVRLIRRRLSASQHDHSVRALGRGDRGEALRWHWRSLLHPGGLQYLTYTRHLLLPRTP
jgi:hypothetical protein